GSPADRVVGLAEMLPTLGVADDRAVHAELLQHLRGYLARVRAHLLPVHILSSDGDLGAGEQLNGDRERDERRADNDVDTLELPLAQAETELGRLCRALVHL